MGSLKIAVKVPIQKVSVSHIVTRQDAVILAPITFAVSHPSKYKLNVAYFDPWSQERVATNVLIELVNLCLFFFFLLKNIILLNFVHGLLFGI